MEGITSYSTNVGQLSTGNRGLAANSITRSKLVQEVAKCVKWHIEDLEANSDVSLWGLLSYGFNVHSPFSVGVPLRHTG